jgi:hypothetical protein
MGLFRRSKKSGAKELSKELHLATVMGVGELGSQLIKTSVGSAFTGPSDEMQNLFRSTFRQMAERRFAEYRLTAETPGVLGSTVLENIAGGTGRFKEKPADAIAAIDDYFLGARRYFSGSMWQ